MCMTQEGNSEVLHPPPPTKSLPRTLLHKYVTNSEQRMKEPQSREKIVKFLVTLSYPAPVEDCGNVAKKISVTFFYLKDS